MAAWVSASPELSLNERRSRCRRRRSRRFTPRAGLPATPPSVSDASLSDSDDEVNADSAACCIAIGDLARRPGMALIAVALLPVLSRPCHGCHPPLLERASSGSGSAALAALLPPIGFVALVTGLRLAGDPVGEVVSAKYGAIAAMAGVRSSFQTWARTCPSGQLRWCALTRSSGVAPLAKELGRAGTYVNLAHGIPDVR